MTPVLKNAPMFIQQIKLSFKGKDERDTYDQLQSFLGTLRQGGQILTKVYPILQKSDAFEAIVMTLEKDALKEENDSIYTLKLRQSFGTALSIKLVGESPFESNLCTCESPTAHVLYTTYVKIGSPLHCGDCFGEVPLYRLGKKESYDAIMSWESNYIACDTLQMNCSVGEAFATDQMSNLDSALNQLGLKCCAEIERLTQKPSYYYLYNYKEISVEEDKKNVCPSCGEAWFLEEQVLDHFDFKCTTCHLLSHLTYQS